MKLEATEKEIQATILHYLAIERIFALRLNSSSFVQEYKGKKRIVRAHSGGKGVADIMAIIPYGRCGSCEFSGVKAILWIEVKGPKGKQSPEQESFQQDVERRGHRYIVARSLEDVTRELRYLRG